jgi:hypothetical protein
MMDSKRERGVRRMECVLKKLLAVLWFGINISAMQI